MSPKEKYGDEFFCGAHVLKKADRSEHPFHDTLVYSWNLMRRHCSSRRFLDAAGEKDVFEGKPNQQAADNNGTAL